MCIVLSVNSHFKGFIIAVYFRGAITGMIIIIGLYARFSATYGDTMKENRWTHMDNVDNMDKNTIRLNG